MGETDIAHLEEVLRETRSPMLPIARLCGFLCAVHASPVMVMPGEFIGVVFPDARWPDPDKATAGLGLLMRYYNDIGRELMAGGGSDLVSVDQIGAWCSGFGEGVGLRAAEWLEHEDSERDELMFPIIIFRGIEDGDLPDELQMPKRALAQLRSVVPAVVPELFAHMRGLG